MTTLAANLTHRMMSFLASVDVESVPPLTLDAARRVLLDHLACGVHGSKFPWTQIVEAEARSGANSHDDAVIYAGSRGLPAALAARVNGSAAHGFELDDFYQPGMVHPGSVVIPAAVAVAHRAQASVGSLLVGITVGYEILGRTGKVLGLWHSNRGFHSTGVLGPIGAGTAAASVLGFDAQAMEHVVGVAASFGCGIKAFQAGGGMIKRLHAGRAAESGVLAADLVARGFTGPTDVVAGPRGVLDVFGGDDVAEHVSKLESLGHQWVVEHIYFKPYSSCAMTHTAIEAIQSLVTQHRIAADDVIELRIGTNQRTLIQNSGFEVTDTTSAQYSLEYAASVALENAAGNPQSFLPEGVTSARKDRMNKVVVELSPEMERSYPSHFGAVVDINTSSGEYHASLLESAEQADSKGAWRLVRAKALVLLADVLGQSRAEKVIDAVCHWDLDTPARELTALVRVEG